MTHVWLVPDPVSTFATCVPFPAFAREGLFTYQPYNVDTQVDTPCSDSASPEQVAQSTGGDAGA